MDQDFEQALHSLLGDSNEQNNDDDSDEEAAVHPLYEHDDSDEEVENEPNIRCECCSKQLGLTGFTNNKGSFCSDVCLQLWSGCPNICSEENKVIPTTPTPSSCVARSLDFDAVAASVAADHDIIRARIPVEADSLAITEADRAAAARQPYERQDSIARDAWVQLIIEADEN